MAAGSRSQTGLSQRCPCWRSASGRWRSLAAPLAASQVRIHRVRLAGRSSSPARLEGVRVDARGVLSLAADVDEVAQVVGAVRLRGGDAPDGWAIGTGGEGRVLKVGRDGKVVGALRRPGAPGLRAAGRSRRHALRRHLARRQGLSHATRATADADAVLRSARDLHLGPGARRRRRALGGDRRPRAVSTGSTRRAKASSPTTATSPTSAACAQRAAATS